MDWFVSFVENSKNLPLISQASVLMALTWGEVSEGVLVVHQVAARDLQRGWSSGQFVEGLKIAERAGWLAPLEWGEGGELRTRLTIPEFQSSRGEEGS
jgi:hypothetical protein